MKKSPKTNRLERFANFAAGLPIFCHRHGEHNKWRIVKDYKLQRDYVRCDVCAAENTKKYRAAHPIKVILGDLNRRYRDNTLVTEEYINNLLNKQDHRCALTGLNFSEVYRPSIDRIDSTKSYIEGNIQMVIVDINFMKTDLPQDYFIQLCKLIAENN